MGEAWDFEWQYGSGQAQALGGMLGPVSFRLRGRTVQPFAVAPWSDEPQSTEVPGHLHRLRGAFPCLPFGVGAPLLDPAPGWEAFAEVSMGGPPHGHCSNEPWHLVARDTGGLTLGFNGPPNDPVATITQRIALDPAKPALSITVEASTKRDARLPFGQHYLLHLPRSRVEIDARFHFGMTYPGTLVPGVSQVQPGQRFASLAAVHGLAGPLDLTHLQVTQPMEEVVQLCGVEGPVTISYPDEGWAARIDWDHALLPSCLIWIGGGGIAEAPWHNRFFGLGIEPIAAAFDLAPGVSAGANPLQAAGIATALAFKAGQPRRIVSSIALL